LSWIALQLIGKEIANPIDCNKHSNAQGPNQQLIKICHKIARNNSNNAQEDCKPFLCIWKEIAKSVQMLELHVL
jgi:hypothetical protein